MRRVMVMLARARCPGWMPDSLGRRCIAGVAGLSPPVGAQAIWACLAAARRFQLLCGAVALRVRCVVLSRFFASGRAPWVGR